GGLSGAVRADQAHNFSSCNFKRGLVNGFETAEVYAHSLHQKTLCHQLNTRLLAATRAKVRHGSAHKNFLSHDAETAEQSNDAARHKDDEQDKQHAIQHFLVSLDVAQKLRQHGEKERANETANPAAQTSDQDH